MLFDSNCFLSIVSKHLFTFVVNRPEFATQWAILSALTAFCSSVKQSSFVRTLYGRDTFADDPEQAVFSNTFRHHHRIGTNSIVDDTDELNRGHLTSPSSSNCSKKMVKTFQAYLPNCHRTYSCVHCRAHLANHDELISKASSICSIYVRRFGWPTTSWFIWLHL